MSVEIRGWWRRVSVYAGIATMVLAAAMLVGFFRPASGQSFSAANRVATAAVPAAPRVVADYGNLPLSFEANQGQTDQSVNFLSRGSGYSLFLTGDEAVLRLKRPGKERETRKPGLAPLAKEVSRSQLQGTTDPGPRNADSLLRVRLVGADRHAIVAGTDELPGKVNYFLGNDPKAWRRNIPTYAKVRYQNIYSGVDLVYYGNQAGQLEYDFVVAPGADPAVITLGVEAQGSPAQHPLRITPGGDLLVRLDGSEVRLHKPVIYQLLAGHLRGARDDGLRTPVQGSYVLTGSRQVRFALGPYDHNQPLVIDPVLSYATYLGGSGAACAPALYCGDGGFGIAVDSSGNAYVTGFTQSADFPATPGAFQQALAGASGARNAFVAELSATGSSLVYATYLGGSGEDVGYSIAVDSTGAYVAGSTTSSNFPRKDPVSGQTTFTGSLDAFVAKLSTDGSALVYSTYLGGSEVQEALGLAVNLGSAYVTGYTSSLDFPTRFPLTGYGSRKGTQNAFVARLDWSGSVLTLGYSTYMGGTVTDTGYAIAVDSTGDAYVTGATNSPDFMTGYPSLTGFGTLRGVLSAFVTKLHFASSALSVVYSTYLGGTQMDEGLGIALDASDSAYVTGATTSSGTFPTTSGAFQTTDKQSPGGLGTVFVSRLDWAANALALGYSTYLGGSTMEFPGGIATDSSGNAYVVGATGSADFPTQNPLPLSLNTTSLHVFVTELNAGGSTLAYSTLLGGSARDVGNAIALDSSLSPNAYVTGETWSTDFPVFNAVQTTNKATPINSGDSTVFVAKISPSAAGTASLSASSIPDFGSQVVNSSPSSPKSVTLNNTGSGPLTIASITISGEFALDASGTCPYTGGTVAASSSCTIAVTFDPTTVGAQAGTVTITDNNGGLPSTQTVSVSGTGTASSSGANLSTPSPFPAQMVGTTSSAQPITLTNSGASSLTITAIVVTSPFGLATAGTTCSSSFPVAANGGTCAIAVTFTPTATGAAAGSLTVTDNASNSPQIANLTGTGTPSSSGASLSTPSAFAAQAVGTTSSAQPITLTNNGASSLTITSMIVTAPFNLATAGTTCSSSTPVAANGGTCTIAVTFSPTAAGAASGTLTVTDNASNSPQIANLTGTGTASPSGASLSTPSAFAGQFVRTTSSAQTVTLTNNGGSSLTISAIAATAPFAIATTGTTCSTSTPVAANGTCTIAVIFSPTAAGAASGTLTVTDNAGNSPQTANLSGTGWDFTLAVASSSSSTQTVAPGGPASYILNLTGLGGFNQAVTFTCTGAPSEATCAASSASASSTGTSVTVSVTTTAPSMVAPLSRRLPPPGPLSHGPGNLIVLAVFLAALTWGLRTRWQPGASRLRTAFVALALGMLLTLSIVACGGGGGGGSGPPPNQGTPAGTYPLTVTGTAGSGTNAATHPVSLTLVVS